MVIKKNMYKLKIRPWRSTFLRQTRCVQELLLCHVTYISGTRGNLFPNILRLLPFSSWSSIAAHLPASLFPRLSPRTMCTMEGDRDQRRRRRRRTSREPEPSILRLSQSPLRVCAANVRENCRARSHRWLCKINQHNVAIIVYDRTRAFARASI